MIFGANSQDIAGLATAISDLDGDGFDDIIISAPSGDGFAEIRFDSGEVYVIYGKTRNEIGDIIDLNINDDTYSTKHYDKVVYSRRINDEMGTDLVVNDFNNDGRPDLNLLAHKGDGYNLNPFNNGNVHILFGKPSITNKEIKLLDGGGIVGNTCYARYKNYTFRANITANRFRSDLKEVNITFAPKSINEFVINWNRTTDTFSSDNYDFVYFTDNSSSKWVNRKNIWSLYITLVFNWTFQFESFTGATIRSLNYEDIEFITPFNFVFKVENDLELSGIMLVTGEYQGELTNGDWVRGGEKITWTNKKVVYDDTIDIYPSDDEFNVTLWDAEGNQIGEDHNSSGRNITLSTYAGNVSNLAAYFTVNITGIPESSSLSPYFLYIRIDADNIEFTNASPSNTTWVNSKIVTCGTTITDINGSNVDATTIGYRMSRENGKNWYPYPKWASPGLNGSFNSTSVDVKVQAEFDDGDDNVIIWQARDAVGNGFTQSQKLTVKIDTHNVTFIDPIPSPAKKQQFEEVICGITIKDTLSGVDARSIQYAYSTDRGQSWSKWINAQQTINATEIECLVNLKLINGDSNYIKWRAMDVAGNGFNISENYWIRVDIALDPDAPNATLFSPRNTYTIPNLNPVLIWTGFDPNGDDITYDVYLNTDENLVKNLQSSARIANDINVTKLEVSLENGLTYYWKVIPSDGFHVGKCVSGTWSFKVDTAVNIPKVDLISPFNRTIINETSVELYWILSFTSEEFVKYNIFIDTNPQFIEPVVWDQLSMSHTIANLENNTRYYWTVLPFAGDKVEGICESGIWWFDVNLSFEIVSNIVLEGPEFIEIWQGENKTYQLIVKNFGNTYDVFDLSFDPGKLGVTVKIDDVFHLEPLSAEMEINETKNCTLQLSIPSSMPPIESTIFITAKSRSTGAFVTHSIEVVVHHIDYDPTPYDPPDGDTIIIDDTAIVWVFIAVIIILVIILGVVLFYRVQKAKKEEEPKETKCSDCGEVVPEGAPECPECGAEIEIEEKESEDGDEEMDGTLKAADEELDEELEAAEEQLEEEKGEVEIDDMDGEQGELPIPATPAKPAAAVAKPVDSVIPAAPQAGQEITPGAPAAPAGSLPLALSLDEITEAKTESEDDESASTDDENDNEQTAMEENDEKNED
jgi:hypothetical protein